jgi:hypothetical protein
MGLYHKPTCIYVFTPFTLFLGSKYSLFNLSLMCLHFQDSRERDSGDGETEKGKGKSLTNTERIKQTRIKEGRWSESCFLVFFFVVFLKVQKVKVILKDPPPVPRLRV